MRPTSGEIVVLSRKRRPAHARSSPPPRRRRRRYAHAARRDRWAALVLSRAFDVAVTALVMTVFAVDVICGVLVWREIRPQEDLAVEVVAAAEPARNYGPRRVI